ncbi:glycosyl transferase [Algibacter sp. Ld11]|uniref:glycosyl transferase n=1 Tax=Algibacter sp. Ld11 TaxID=649150 RepID=UPI00386A488A
MKIVKELPKSIWHSIFLHFASPSFLVKDKETLPLIVSLTSIPSRFNTLHLVIKSLFNQSHLPTKIILWLHEDLKNNLPKSIERLQSSLFEIKYSPLTCSHKKLIHTLKNYPDSIIITCDDDLIYDKNLVKNLYEEHLKFPKDVIANRANQIKFDEDKGYRPFNQWKFKDVEMDMRALCPIGAWGILYPPHSLHNDIFNEDLFLKLTPKADDLWFKAMAILNGTLARQATNLPNEPIPIIGTQKVALKKENISKNKNDLQWEALSKHYNLYNVIKAKTTK